MLRERSDGRPVGIKIAAGRIERDLEFCVFAQPDFITIDGRGGATGSSPFLLREATTVPTVYALYRARKYLDSVHSDISAVTFSPGRCPPMPGFVPCPILISTASAARRFSSVTLYLLGMYSNIYL